MAWFSDNEENPMQNKQIIQRYDHKHQNYNMINQLLKRKQPKKQNKIK